MPQDHSNYPSTSQEKIDDFNMALLTMCENLGVKFLNSAEVLKDPATGFGQDDYYISGDIHLKSSGLKAMLNYLTTHAYETEDRRPDTSNIPTRTLEYTSNPSDPVAAPSSSSSEAAGEAFEARYRIDQTGGTLTSGDTSGETSLRFDVTGEQSVTVTAVPDDGYFFVNWSDGVTSRTRTDSNFKQNLDVTAVFSRASVEIAGEGSGLLGMNYTFTARLSGQYAKAENLHWYVNDVESKEAAGRTSVSFIVDPLLANQTYTVYAAVTYNDSQVVSNTLTVSFESGIGTGSSSSSSSSSSSASGSSSSGSSSSSASGSEVEDPSEEVSASSSSSSSSSSGSSGSSSGAGSSSSRPSSSGSSDASSSSSSHAGS
ncbi:MAG TPA: SGNH/GDSL hydrolase family protein, partial [Deinococcales bacterium]|nr:SGNH/GDSL hydrolase family protein [Deinococcales bacterium]